MDDFSEIIGYLVFFIFFVLPRILKFLSKNKKKPQPPKPSKPVKPMGVPTLEEILNPAPAEPAMPSYSEAELRAYRAMIDRLEGEIITHSEEVLDVVNFAKARGGGAEKMATIIPSTTTGPLRQMQRQVQRLKANIVEPNDGAAYNLEQQLLRQRNIFGLLRQMTEQRIKPDRAEILSTMDMACKEAFRPFQIHANRMNLPLQTEYMLSVMDDVGTDFAALLQHTNVGVAVVSKAVAELPKGWIEPISDVGMDVCYSTKGLLRQMESTLGTVSPPRSVGHYRDVKAIVAGLISAWLPRIFGDVVCVLYLGPGALYGMQALYNADETLVSDLGHTTMRFPLHLRVYLAARVLARMGFQALASERWEAWERRLGNPQELSLKDGSQQVTFPLSPLRQAVGNVVDYLIKEPLPRLGNHPLPHVPSLLCNHATLERMEAMVPFLKKGEARNGPSRVIMGAALLAQEEFPTMERRIGRAAMDGMAGKGVIVAAPPIPSLAGGQAPSILDAARTPRLTAQAVALAAALAPRRVSFRR